MMAENRRGYQEGISVVVVLVLFIAVLLVLLIFFLLFTRTANAGAVNAVCGVEDDVRSKLLSYGTGGEVIADITMPVHPTCGEIINEPCATKQACIDIIQDRMKNVCWVRGGEGAKSGEASCLNSLPIGPITGNITPSDICGLTWGTKTITCATPGPPAFDTGVLNGKIVWVPPKQSIMMNAVEHSSIGMRYVDGTIEVSCISAYDECIGTPTPI